MINYHAISSAGDAATYHDKAFVKDGNVQAADNYYIDQQAPATWRGNGARILGIEGQQVTKEQFVAMLEGRVSNPNTGKEQDLRANGHENRRPGMDLVIAPPKSVSVVALVGGDERVVAAHEKANEKAMKWLEEHAAVIRVDGGRESAGNLVWATIQHQTNRENEPHLHSHNVVMAMVYDTERDTWRSLTNDELLKLRAYADEIYKAELAVALQKLGYEIEATKDGFEIKGIDREQILEFSGRSVKIGDRIREMGFDPEYANWKVRQAATLDTRSAKQEVTAEALHIAWAHVAKEVGLDVDAVVRIAKDRTPEVEQAWPTIMRESRRMAGLAVSEAVEHLSTREQAFKMSDIEKEAARFGGGLVPIDHLKESIQDHIKGGHLVTREGMSDGAEWYTTQRGITSEKLLEKTISEGKDRGSALVASEDEFQLLVAAFNERKTAENKAEGSERIFALTSEQINAAHNLLMHPDRIQGIQGDAGTGKTAALEFVNEVATKKNFKVIGMATGADAAKRMQADSGIESKTVAAYLTERTTQERVLKDEIDSLRHKLITGIKVNGTNLAQAEVQRLSVQTTKNDFGTHTYFFDNTLSERGVWRGDGSLKSQLGEFLVNAATRQKQGEIPVGKTVGETYKVRMSEKVADWAQSFGQGLIDFKQVDIVEANAARNALYDVKRDEISKMVFTQLKEAEGRLDNLKRFGNVEGKEMLVVLDEAGMTGIHDGVKVINDVANLQGARMVLQGDTEQTASVAAGRLHEQAQRMGMNTSYIEQTMRFNNATREQRAAVVALKGRGYEEALMYLKPIEVKDDQLHDIVSNRYLEIKQEYREANDTKSTIGVVTITNLDRKEINLKIHCLLQQDEFIEKENHTREHFDAPRLTEAESRNPKILLKSNVNRLVFNQRYQEIGAVKGDVFIVTGYDLKNKQINGYVESTGKSASIDPEKIHEYTPYVLESRQFSVGDSIQARAVIRPEHEGQKQIANGTRGVIVSVGESGSAEVQWDYGGKGEKQPNAQISPNQIRFMDYGYTRTVQGEQGATNEREISAISATGAKVFNAASDYVSLTRAKDMTEIFSSDVATMMRSAGKEIKKTTAIPMEAAGAEYFKEAHQSFKEKKLAEAAEILAGADSAPTQDLAKHGALERSPEPTRENEAKTVQQDSSNNTKGQEKVAESDLSR